MSEQELIQRQVVSGLRLPGAAECLESLLGVVQRRGASLREVADAVERDPALLFDYMRLAQPATPATWLTVFDPELARAIAITRGIEVLRENGQLGDNAPVIDIWMRSLGMAVLNEAIVQCLFAGREGALQATREAYLVGLLANIGQLANIGNRDGSGVPPDAHEQATLALDQDVPPAAKTTVDLAAKSAEMLEACQCNSLFVDAVRFRDMPADTLGDSHWMVRSLAVSSALVELLLTEPGPGSLQEHHNFLAEQLLGLEPEQIGQCVENAGDRLTGILGDLNIQPRAVIENQRPMVDQQASLLRGTVSDSSVLAVVTNLLEKSDDFQAWWLNVQLISRLMFGFGNVLLFQLDPARRQLVPADVSTDVSGFAISLDRPNSILAQSVKEQRLSTTGELPALAVVDQQLIRLLRAEALVCIPLANASDVVGVLVCGVSNQDLEPPVATNGLLGLFAELIAEQYQKRLIARSASIDSLSRIDPEYFQIRAREVTHEINNPLSVVQNYMRILSLKLGEDNSAQADLKTISEEINRISGIVQKFSHIVSESEIGASVLDLNEIVRDIVGVFRGSAPEARFVLNLDTNIPALDISRDSIKQVLVNLLKNSLEAMENKGSIVVRTTAQVSLGGEPHVEIMIGDDGPGIPGEIQQQLFKRVRTSKGPAHGGLGLSIVKKLVDEMKGQITCRSGENAGTDFQILLPVNKTDNNE